MLICNENNEIDSKYNYFIIPDTELLVVIF